MNYIRLLYIQVYTCRVEFAKLSRF